jgi:hypothetical protein
MDDEAPTNPGVAVPRRHQPVSLQQAIAAALVSALLGGLGGAGGGITFGEHSHDDLVHSADLDRVEKKLDRLNDKFEEFDAKFVDLRIALAGRGIAAPAPQP